MYSISFSPRTSSYSITPQAQPIQSTQRVGEHDDYAKEFSSYSKAYLKKHPSLLKTIGAKVSPFLASLVLSFESLLKIPTKAKNLKIKDQTELLIPMTEDLTKEWYLRFPPKNS
jgi:hypothetical protein